MIPRYQRILFWSLFGGIFLMSAFLIHGCQQAQKRLTSLGNAAPIAAPAANEEDVTLYLANDAEGSITPTPDRFPVPKEPTLRARAVLEHLLASYASNNSAHPLQTGPAVDDVFLLADPNNPGKAGQLAVINLSSGFVEHHPSGLQVEALTIASIVGTLHDALPDVTGVRFLVNGQPHDTLAGHADLTQTYPAADTTAHPKPPSENLNTPSPD